ncbi:hypothetical protein [Agromyces sp. ZXT2-6]|uniref:hypothetical protein n=1 Tax=Agromyces sp. ZXT2-6 TaxID=3461153 RepID=UPI0040551A01
METDVNHPVRGRRIHLVRWVRSDGGWTSEVRQGRYLDDDVEAWVLDVDDVEVRLPRDEWQRFVPDHEPQLRPRGDGRAIVTVRVTSRPVFDE